MEGYIALYRKLLEKPIWITSTAEQRVIFVTILLLANHKANEWEWGKNKFKVHPGQFVTSLDSLAKQSGTTVRNVRTALTRFEKLGFLTNESTKSGRLITVVNWGFYQQNNTKVDKDADKGVTKTRQRTDKGVSPINNDKNEKKRNIPVPGGTPDAHCPYQKIMDLYHQMCPSLPKIKTMTEERKRTIQAWWTFDPDLTEISQVFSQSEQSDFLTGRTGKFTASFDWIIKVANRTKIIEGNYKNKNGLQLAPSSRIPYKSAEEQLFGGEK